MADKVMNEGPDHEEEEGHEEEEQEDEQGGDQGQEEQEESQESWDGVRRSSRKRKPRVIYGEEEEEDEEEVNEEDQDENKEVKGVAEIDMPWEHPVELKKLLVGPLAKEMTVIVSRPIDGGGDRNRKRARRMGMERIRMGWQHWEKRRERNSRHNWIKMRPAEVQEDYVMEQEEEAMDEQHQRLQVSHGDGEGEEDEMFDNANDDGERDESMVGLAEHFLDVQCAGGDKDDEGDEHSTPTKFAKLDSTVGEGTSLYKSERKGPIALGIFRDPVSGEMRYYCRHRCGQYLVTSKGRRKHEKVSCKRLKEGSDPNAILAVDVNPEDETEDDYRGSETVDPENRPGRRRAFEMAGNGAYYDPLSGGTRWSCRFGCGGNFGSVKGRRGHERKYCRLNKGEDSIANAAAISDEEPDFFTAEDLMDGDTVQEADGSVRFTCRLGCGKNYVNKKSRRIHEKNHCRANRPPDNDTLASNDTSSNEGGNSSQHAKGSSTLEDDPERFPCRNNCGVSLVSAKGRYKHEKHHCKVSPKETCEQDTLMIA